MGLKRKLTKKKLIEAGLDKEKNFKLVNYETRKRTKDKGKIWYFLLKNKNAFER